MLIEHPAGPEKYTYYLFNALAKIDDKNEYVIYFNKKPNENYFRKLTNENPNFTSKVIARKSLWTQVGLALELLRNPPDAFFTAAHTIPVVRNPKTKFISMIHGLEYKYSAAYKNPLRRLSLHWPEWFVYAFSDKIIVPSQATKDAISNRKWICVKEKKIEIISEGVDKKFHPYSKEEIQDVLKKYNLGNTLYLIFVSTIQPRKNLPGLVGGFAQALRENSQYKDVKLVVVGKEGWDYKESLKAPEKFSVQNNVIFLGRVPDNDLPKLISGAKAYVNVSFEEGFGLPLAEAIACGISTVVSDIPAHREVGGNFPIFVNPHNSRSIKQGIVETLEKEINKDFEKNRRDFVNRYSWENTALKTLSVISAV